MTEASDPYAAGSVVAEMVAVHAMSARPTDVSHFRVENISFSFLSLAVLD